MQPLRAPPVTMRPVGAKLPLKITCDHHPETIVLSNCVSDISAALICTNKKNQELRAALYPPHISPALVRSEYPVTILIER